MANEGLKRFLRLVPEKSVYDAQIEAQMSDQEIENLIDLAVAILDSDQRSSTLYDLGVVRRMETVESELTARINELSASVDRMAHAMTVTGQTLCQFVGVTSEVIRNRNTDKNTDKNKTAPAQTNGRGGKATPFVALDGGRTLRNLFPDAEIKTVDQHTHAHAHTYTYDDSDTP